MFAMHMIKETGCLLLAICLLLTGTAAAQTAPEDGWFRQLAQRVAAQQFAEILIHPETDAPVDAALDAVLAQGTDIRRAGQEGVFDFPRLEWEEDGLACRVCGVYGKGGVESWVVTFFPAGLSTMATAVAMTPGGQVLEVFGGSSWAMHTLWEEALGDPSYFWQPETVFRFSQLFEGDTLWMRAHRPGHRDIPQQEALRIAADALREKYGISDGERSLWRTAAAFHLSDHTVGQLVWAIHYYRQEGEEYTLLYSVIMDSRSGLVLECTRNEAGGLG